MANRIRPVEEKVQAVLTALDHINVAAAAREAGVPASTLSYDLKKVIKCLPETLANQKPGPKPRKETAEAPVKTEPPEEPRWCPECGGKVRKNGTYWVLNWVLMLTMGWLGVQKALVQRRRCKECGHEVVSSERARQAEAREAWWQQVNRLIGLSRFKMGLSVRKTQIVVGFV